MSQIWNTVFFEPMLNALFLLYSLLGRNFGLAIIVFTVVVRLLTLPITLQQMRQAKATQEIQPKIEELKKKYKGDQEKLGQEQMKLYKEHGVNPLGCLLPTLIQFPIWIGMYQSIVNALPDNPVQMVNLSQHLYHRFPHLSSLLPLNSSFLGLDLGRPFPVLAVFVALTMWVNQKMMATPSADPQQQAMSQSMELTMPLMFGLITSNVASGLGMYFVVTNVLQIVQQYYFTGWGGLAKLLNRPPAVPKSTKAKDRGNERKS